MRLFSLSLIFSVTLLCAAPLMAAPFPQRGNVSTVAGIDKLTLKESILFALDRDPSVSQQAAQTGIGQAQIDEARSAWFPQVSLNGNTGHSRTTDSSGSLKNSAAWGLSLTQLVYDFGKTNNTIDQQKKRLDSYRYQLMATLTHVAEQTALTYVEVKRYDALIAAAHNNINALEAVQHIAGLRADAGLSSSSDVLQTHTRIGGMRAMLEQYQAALQSARARLGVLTGVDARSYAALPDSMLPEQTSLEHIDYSMVPGVMAAQAMEDASRSGVERAKAERWPTLSVRGGRTRYQSDNRNYWDDQIQFNVEAPLYQGGAVSARVAQAEGARNIAMSQVEQAKFDVLQKASVALADWQGAWGREAASQSQYENALRAREVYRNEYKLSKRSLNDLLSVEQDVWQAESSRITADYDGWAAAVNYAAAIDSLLPLAGIAKDATNTLPNLN